MMDNNEDRDEETTPMEEPVEEVQISDEAQQIVEESAADSEEAEMPDEPEAAPEPSPEQEAAEMKDRLLRALADVENTRRRAKRDVEDARKYAASNFAKDLLNVSDNLRRALDTVSEETREGDDIVKNLVLGIEMVEKELLTAFERQGVSKVDPLGEPFDHNFHQAMYEKPDTEYPNGTVAEVMQPGYVMHDRLLRPAMVAVAKGGGEEQDPPSEVDPVDTTA
ncbi:MAG: nucleotide exchange factor GrpE [Rhodospirillaceae bacterium TMED256]|nr:MAG: nucleotide exchange factor GrpE [Rhodospirillaceae bacterium TMED256]|tara:strand:+ start:1519 stop:2187 length:669 start_codon:yes stop_codon:yes gene_type:complete